MSKKPLPTIDPSLSQAIDQFHDAKVGELLLDTDVLQAHAASYPEMQSDHDPALVQDMRARLMQLPMVHRTNHPNFGGGNEHDEILPTSELGYGKSGSNTYALDFGMGLHEFTFLRWGALTGEDEFLKGARYAVLIDPRHVLRMPETIATPHDVASHISDDMLHSQVFRNIGLPRTRRVANALGDAIETVRDAKDTVKASAGRVALRASTTVTYHKTRLKEGERKAHRAVRDKERQWAREHRRKDYQDRREGWRKRSERSKKDREAQRPERRQRHIRYGEESLRIINNYFRKIVGGQDWLEIEARRLAGMVEHGEASADVIPLTADTLGEIKVSGRIPRDAVIGIIDLYDDVAVEAYQKIVRQLGFDIKKPRGLKWAATKKMGHDIVEVLDDTLHL